MENSQFYEKTPLVRSAHKLKSFSNSSLAMPVKSAPRHSVMAYGPSLTDARFGILCLPRRKWREGRHLRLSQTKKGKVV